MTWVDEAKREAVKQRDQAIDAAKVKFRRAMALIDQVAAALAADATPPGAAVEELQTPAQSPTEALREAFLHLPDEFTYELVAEYVRQRYPDWVRDLSSAFNKLRMRRGEVQLVQSGHGSEPPTFRWLRHKAPRNEKAPASTGA